MLFYRYLLFIFYFYFTSYVIASPKRIWLLRHCDKLNDENSCCSDIGYNRSFHWKRYFERYFTSKNTVKIYASNYHEKKECIPNNHFISNENCQKSQRMYITGHIIHITLQNVNTHVNTNYCVGDYKDMINEINNNSSYTDVIIVWEHKEIIKILHYLGIKISKWSKHNMDIYNLIFMLDTYKKILYYDCYDYKTNTMYCEDNVDNWLHNFPKINENYFIDNENYFTHNKTVSFINNKTVSFINNKTVSNNLLIFFMLVVYVIIMYIIYTYCNYHKKQYRIIGEYTPLLDENKIRYN